MTKINKDWAPIITVASLSINADNTEVESAFEYLSGLSLSTNVICLQHVSEPLLRMLQQKFPGQRLCFVPESKQEAADGRILSYYSVILVKPPLHIQYYGYLPLSEERPASMPCDRRALYVDVAYENQLIRIFSVNLASLHKSDRVQAWETITQKMEPGLYSILCGTFASPAFLPNILSFFHCGMPQRFRKSGLRNIFQGRSTASIAVPRTAEMFGSMIVKPLQESRDHVVIATIGLD